jgi:plasmid stabilization system protein ParE
MTFQLLVTDEAEKELTTEYNWYEDKQEGLGLKFISAVEETFKLIEAFPFAFPFRRKDYRECFIGAFPYVIIYRVVREKIFIHRVFEVHQHPRKKARTRKSK